MSNAQEDAKNLEQKVAHLEDRLQIYEEIDEKINRYNLGSMNTFRAFLAGMSFLISLAAIVIVLAGFSGMRTLSEASQVLDDANKKSAELITELERSDETLQHLQAMVTVVEEKLADTTRKVANIETDVNLSKDGSGILLGGYDVIVMNKALIDILQKKEIITEDEAAHIIQASIPEKVDDYARERGLIILEQSTYTDHPPIIE